MSRENVEIVRRAYEAMNNSELSRMPEFLETGRWNPRS
jgi:hypothetical protein